MSNWRIILSTRKVLDAMRYQSTVHGKGFKVKEKNAFMTTKVCKRSTS